VFRRRFSGEHGALVRLTPEGRRNVMERVLPPIFGKRSRLRLSPRVEEGRKLRARSLFARSDGLLRPRSSIEAKDFPEKQIPATSARLANGLSGQVAHDEDVPSLRSRGRRASAF